MVLILIIVSLVLIGLVITTVEVFLTLRLVGKPRDGQPAAGAAEPLACSEHSGVRTLSGQIPIVSILKPISGLEDELEENLISFANLRGTNHELILSVCDANDPALEVIERVRPRFPPSRFSVVIGGAARAANPKVERLIAAVKWAKGRILFISDSNIRVAPDHMAATVAAFADPTVGCVSNPFVGQGARTLGATIESLHLVGFVLPGCALANALRIPCVVGKSMAISRDAYAAIGGFEPFASIIAEDQAMALAIRKAGYKLVLSRTAVRNVVVNRSLRAAMDRQVRWNKIRYAFSKLVYTSEFLANPFPLSLMLVGACAAIDRGAVSGACIFSALTLGVRLLHAGIVVQRLRTQSVLPAVLLLPVQELLQFAAQFKPYFSNEVNWRGHRARLGHGSAMLLPAAGEGNPRRRGSMQTGVELR